MRDYKFETIQSIGIIGWGLMGDVLVRTPVIRALRHIFPNARIVVSVDPIGAEVLKNNHDVTKVLIFNRKKRPKWKHLFNKLIGWKDIRIQNFDLLIDLYGSRSSSDMLRLSGAKYKIGFTHSRLRDKIYNLEFPKEFEAESSLHLSKHLLKILSVVGEEYQKYSCRPIFTTSLAVDKGVKEYKDSFGLQKSYLLNIASGGIEKIVPEQITFEQIKHIYEEFGYSPLIINNPGQEYLQDNFVTNYLIASEIPFGVLKRLNLEEIGALMKYCDFMVTPDTGLYHIAAAIGIPIIGMFPHTNPLLVEPEDGVFVHCFQPDDTSFYHGIPYGKKDLDLDYVKKQTSNLIGRL